MNAIAGMSPISSALSGLRRADESLMAAVQAVNSGSLDLNSMAEAAALLQSAEIQAAASATVLRSSVEMDRHFIDILA